MTDIKTVGVIGGGVMGSGIAQALAVGGCRVTVRDLNEELHREVEADDRRGPLRAGPRRRAREDDAGGRGRGAGAAVVDDEHGRPQRTWTSSSRRCRRTSS